MRRALGLVAAVVAVSGCGGSLVASPTSREGTAAMEVTGGFVPAPAGSVAAAYLTITNRTGRDDALVSASTPSATKVELHATRIDAGGIATMDPSGTVPIPDGATVRLEPGHSHLMLMDAGTVREGQTVTLTLRFDHAAAVTVAVPVTAIGSIEPPS